MDPTAGWTLRYVRAAVLSSGALGLAALAHVSAGGLLPDVWAFVAMLAVCTLASGTRLGREAPRVEIVALLVAGQTILHGVMTALSGHAGDLEPPPANLEHALSHAVEHLAEDLTWAHAPMMLGHLAAAVATGLWLAYGERTLWSLVRLVAAATGTILRVLDLPAAGPAGDDRAHRAVERFEFTTAIRQALLSTTHVRRGPPAVLRAC